LKINAMRLQLTLLLLCAAYLAADGERRFINQRHKNSFLDNPSQLNVGFGFLQQS
jgi:hypothetical protein